MTTTFPRSANSLCGHRFTFLSCHHHYHHHHYFAPGREAKYCDQRVCLSVCLSARISQSPHVQILRNFRYILPVADIKNWRQRYRECFEWINSSSWKACARNWKQQTQKEIPGSSRRLHNNNLLLSHMQARSFFGSYWKGST